ncbi:hypothetical protein GCM10007857_43310 [Bradyrhizobium iriomotense]|uniref:Uncharacterized protein n=1 Tax=Bradyrhizobium iriomotense TaxID=441950 RepID=A0ABQ6AZY0_9BRAD|nr:hypothetical protein GCM10007857_43310 [Bradyrhizobium iriomotense]
MEPFLAGYGVVESEAFVHSERWMVAELQLRTMRFLFDYCELDTALWDIVLGRAETTVRKAAYGELKRIRLLMQGLAEFRQ